MVSHVPQPPTEVMRMRLAPKPAQSSVALPPENVFSNLQGSSVNPVPPPWKFVVAAADGTELLTMREEGGMLVVEGDESRWTEAAKRFVGAVLQWTGQAPITWKDEARRAAGDR